MKNLNEGNGKIIPLSDEELQQATGGAQLAPEDQEEFCGGITSRSTCMRFRIYCGWYSREDKCYAKAFFPDPDLLEYFPD